MLYPKITNIHKSNLIIKILSILSVVVIGISLLINYLIDTKIHWSYIVVIGIIYAWLTTSYSIKKNKNIASHTTVQLIVISILMILLDLIIGYKGWSVNYAIPISIIIANTCFVVLAIITYHKYVKYIVYQFIVFLLGLLPLVFTLTGLVTRPTLSIISTIIGIICFGFTVIISRKEIIQEIKGRFNL